MPLNPESQSSQPIIIEAGRATLTLNPSTGLYARRSSRLALPNMTAINQAMAAGTRDLHDELDVVARKIPAWGPNYDKTFRPRRLPVDH